MAKNPDWTDEEQDTLVKMWHNGESLTAINRVIRNRSFEALRLKAYSMGLVRGTKKPYTMDEIGQLKQAYTLGVPISKIARQIGHSISSVQQMAQKCGLKRRGRNRWTEGQRSVVTWAVDSLIDSLAARFGCTRYAVRSLIANSLISYRGRQADMPASDDWKYDQKQRREESRNARLFESLMGAPERTAPKHNMAHSYTRHRNIEPGTST